MKEEEEYEKKLKERYNDLQQEHKETIERFNPERDGLRRRIRNLEREIANLSKPGCSKQEDQPMSKPEGPKQQSRPESKPEGSKQETREVSKQAVKSEQQRQVEAVEEIKRNIRHLERDLEKYEDAKKVPPRPLMERSERMNHSLMCAFCKRTGLHFSDSCRT
ncbi:unnamed protein product [Nippostrongylus brasiliensis]|uniref:Trichohyalin-like n=1 Tax=Nippostrongylus brasiliensis TaxID=27835 RepID=A0A0N4YB70_NIPBR|nr:hypothetical protein Q1695_014692 [Nippostrongylus brasiliensis]VDL77279.1 unnamed protein product [Nippostrongylus brasiliensis]